MNSGGHRHLKAARGGGAHRSRSLAAICRAGGLTPGQLPVETNPNFKPMNSYQAAFMNLDSDGPQYISSNARDEQSHAAFPERVFAVRGRTASGPRRIPHLAEQPGDGAQQIGRLTNLTKLSVDTSWYVRYRSATNPDFGATLPQALPALPRVSSLRSPGPTRISRRKPCPGDRQHRCVPFRVHRAGRHQPLCFTQPEGEEPRSAADHPRDRRRRDLPISWSGWIFRAMACSRRLAPFTDPTNGLTFPNFDA